MTVNAKESAVYGLAKETASFIQSKVPNQQLQRPRVAIVCGSGLGGIADNIEDGDRFEIPYSDIPNFPKTTVVGHAGKLVFGFMSETKVPVVLLVGRAHFYEGHAMELVTFATRVCKLLEVQTMIVTNAAGGLNPDYNVGDIVLLNDHLNLAGLAGFHPLRGPNADDFGVRFPPLSEAYDLELRQRAHRIWNELPKTSATRKLNEGVYAFVSGPSYETRAECRLLHKLGADLVGMSTVPEIIVARHSGIKILAFSLVTNCAVLDSVPRGDDAALQSMSSTELEAHLSKGKANHEEVLEAGREAAKDMQDLVQKIVSTL
ncbi:hypothetical protein K461DRAFT_287078 [Myriangium duriaei CBS 260.36]|uniref:Purine nucleoside phosphorylase n=1 Tax=Myriangium duriaei CBS 260.36 TaxID=1168546 RepID=A0A9P4MFI6_9PEZI|nr:hypothetical protein K461DRAFT_287078 [Myriangium duriaei CBS 260.36]